MDFWRALRHCTGRYWVEKSHALGIYWNAAPLSTGPSPRFDVTECVMHLTLFCVVFNSLRFSALLSWFCSYNLYALCTGSQAHSITYRLYRVIPGDGQTHGGNSAWWGFFPRLLQLHITIIRIGSYKSSPTCNERVTENQTRCARKVKNDRTVENERFRWDVTFDFSVFAEEFRKALLKTDIQGCTPLHRAGKWLRLEFKTLDSLKLLRSVAPALLWSAFLSFISGLGQCPTGGISSGQGKKQRACFLYLTMSLLGCARFWELRWKVRLLSEQNIMDI